MTRTTNTTPHALAAALVVGLLMPWCTPGLDEGEQAVKDAKNGEPRGYDSHAVAGNGGIMIAPARFGQ